MEKEVYGKIQSACNMEMIEKIGRFMEKANGKYPSLVNLKKGFMNQVFFELDDEKIALLTDPEIKGMIHFDGSGNLVEETEIHISALNLSDNTILFSFSLEEKKEEKKVSEKSGKIKEIIENGILTEEGIEKRERILLDNKVTEEIKEKVFSFILQNGKQEEVREISAWYVPGCSQDFYINDYLGCCIRGNSLLLSGGQSTGKSLFAKTIAYLLNLPSEEQVVGGSSTQEDIMSPKTTDNGYSEALVKNSLGGLILSLVSGGKDLKDVCEELGVTIEEGKRLLLHFKLSEALSSSPRVITEITPLVNMMRKGGILILNEINYADTNEIASTLNPLLDGTGYVIIEGIGKVDIHKNFRIIGTYNPGYEGTKELNQALCSRFTKINVGYPKNTLEILKQGIKEKGKESATCDLNALTRLARFFDQIVEGYKGRVWGDETISVRGFARAYRDYAEDRIPLIRGIEMEVLAHAAPGDFEKLHEKARLLFPD